MKSLFAKKTDNSFFFNQVYVIMILLCSLDVFFVIFNLIKITQLQFDWD